MRFNARMENLIQRGQESLLQQGLKGLEKESLRMGADGRIAQTAHPKALGSALTHPSITTDYSEALIELITPAFSEAEAALKALKDIHGFVYRHLGDEFLLATSMPVGINGDESIPIAEYGRSNIGQMKHIYRKGLSYRYGRTMQAIAGLHYNFSFNEGLWPALMEIEGHRGTSRDFIDDAYFGVVRNIHRYGWLLIYLFGNSPALSRPFLKGREGLQGRFSEMDADTLYWPNATSLRMSDIGYRNDSQTHLDISFNGIDAYVESLESAIKAIYPPYEAIGVRVNGEYRQLNANILQIENEYYSLIRPKQVAQSGERPTTALRARGVRYIELRAVDLMAFQPEGISLDQMHFLEVFATWCLLTESAPLDRDEKAESGRNALAVACCARGDDFELEFHGEPYRLTVWAGAILKAMLPVAELMDRSTDDKLYQRAVERWIPVARDPQLTPSAEVLRQLRQQKVSFAEWALNLSRSYQTHWRSYPLDDAILARFNAEARDSIIKQQSIEAADTLPFEDFLAAYWKSS